MRRPITFFVSVGVAVLVLFVTLPFALWIPHMDAPEMVAPILSITFGGGAMFVIAVAVAIYAARPPTPR
jgi:hypothetical protein